MLHYGNVTIGNSKILTALIVIQKVNPMTRGRINPATLDNGMARQRKLPPEASGRFGKNAQLKLRLELRSHTKLWTTNHGFC
jgi:hypothetical protein